VVRSRADDKKKADSIASPTPVDDPYEQRKQPKPKLAERPRSAITGDRPAIDTATFGLRGHHQLTLSPLGSL